jgi:hypothetical protein
MSILLEDVYLRLIHLPRILGIYHSTLIHQKERSITLSKFLFNPSLDKMFFSSILLDHDLHTSPKKDFHNLNS